VGGAHFSQIGGTELNQDAIAAAGGLPGPNPLTACVRGGSGASQGSPGYPPCATSSPTPLRSVLASWGLSTHDESATSYRLLRIFGAGIRPTSVVIAIPPDNGGPLATQRVDAEELPHGQRFTYYVQAMFGPGDKSGLSIPAEVWTQNDAPVAQNDNYGPANLVGGFVVGNLFNNDTDPDLGPTGKSKWTAVDAGGAPLAIPGLSFSGAPGQFTYDRTFGSVTFTYRVDPGDWTDGVNVVPMSPNSNLATVVIDLRYQVTVYPLKSPAQLGSSVPVEFLIKFGGVIVKNPAVIRRIETVRNGAAPCGPASPVGTSKILYSSPPASGDTGSSNLRNLADGRFRLNWDTTVGTTKGCYTVLITLDDDAAANPRMTNAVQLK
jgi:hypothetical protein